MSRKQGKKAQGDTESPAKSKQGGRAKAASGKPTKAERREARARQKGEAAPAAGGNGGGSDAGLEERLGRIEEAVAAQSELSETLLKRLDEVLTEARKPGGAG